jgi:PAS domain S-box-containing protein
MKRYLWVPAVAAGWIAVIGYVHWVWAPRSMEAELARQRTAIAAELGRLSAEVAPMLRAGALEGARGWLDAAAGAHPEWVGMEVRSSGGQFIRAGNIGAAAGSGVRQLDQAVNDGAVVRGWISAVADFSPMLMARRDELAALEAALAAGLALSLALTVLAYRSGPRRELTRLADAVRVSLREHRAPAPEASPASPLAWLGASYEALAGALARRESELAVLQARCAEAREALDESEARYAQAVRGAADGLWEWDLRAGTVFYSPRWKSMLGYAEDEVGDSVDEWKSRIHADDLPSAVAAAEEHLSGAVPRFDHEHRLRRKDGRYIWVHARGTALRGPTGRPHRLVGLNTDVTTRKRAQEILIGLADGLASARGEDFFRSLVRNFARVLGVRYAFVTECVDSPATRVRKLASWKDEEFAQTNEFDLAGTPCNETVNQGRPCIYPSGVGIAYEREKMWESYLGIPIFDAAGRVIGHLACYHDQPFDEELPVGPIFSLFAVRAGLELERRALLEALN